MKINQSHTKIAFGLDNGLTIISNINDLKFEQEIDLRE